MTKTKLPPTITRVEIYCDNISNQNTSPREDENNLTIFALITVGRNRKLDFINEFDLTGYEQDDYEQWYEELSQKAFFYPLYVYDHSGLAFSRSNQGYPFNCNFDVAQVGHIYIEHEKMENELIELTQAQADRLVDAEIENLNIYCQEGYFAYRTFDDQGNIVDDCGGFLGSNIEENGMKEYLYVEQQPLLEEAAKNIIFD